MIAGLIYFILALGVIVLVHELGHLMLAKKFNVYCYEFSIGMGPKLVTFYVDKSGTKYNIRAIPLGGYVMMAGEQNDSKDLDVDPSLLLDSKKIFPRFLIMVAGAVMNFIFAVVVLIGLALVSPVFVADDSIAANAVNIVENTPAASSGIENGDLIVAIDDTSVASFVEISMALDKSSEIVNISYFDQSEQTEKSVEITKTAENTIGITTSGMINPLTGMPSRLEKLSFADAVVYGFTAFFEIVISIVASLMLLFTGGASVTDLSGPVGIYSVSSQILAISPALAVYWVAYLSINIGFVNLLPIPALDGGRILLLMIEFVIRRPLSKKLQEYLIIGSMLLLFGILIISTFSDVLRLFQ